MVEEVDGTQPSEVTGKHLCRATPVELEFTQVTKTS